MNLLIAGILGMFLVGPALGHGNERPYQPVEGPALGELKAAEGSQGDLGKVMDGSGCLPSAALPVATANSEEVRVPTYQQVKEAATLKGCPGAFECGIGALTVVTPAVVGGLHGGYVGYQSGKRNDGWPAAIGLGLLGGIAGLVVGALLTPVWVVSGLARAVGHLLP